MTQKRSLADIFPELSPSQTAKSTSNQPSSSTQPLDGDMLDDFSVSHAGRQPVEDDIAATTPEDHESSHHHHHHEHHHHHHEVSNEIVDLSSSTENNDKPQDIKDLDEFIKTNDEAKKAVHIIHKFFEHRMIRKNLKKLNQMSKKRRHVINEIVTTEKSYIADLKTIMDVFYTPIVKKGIETKENIASIFVNVEMIYNLNEKLYHRLVAAQEHQLSCDKKQNEMIERLVKTLREKNVTDGSSFEAVVAACDDSRSVDSNENLPSARQYGTEVYPNSSLIDLHTEATGTLSVRRTTVSGLSQSNSSQNLESVATDSKSASTKDDSSIEGKNKNKKNNKKKKNGTIKTLKEFKNKFTIRGKLHAEEDSPAQSSTTPTVTPKNASHSSSFKGATPSPTVQAKSFGGAFAEMAPFMILYTEYINNFSQATSILKERRKKNPQLNNYLNKCKELRKECRELDISAFLILPVQRIPKYQLLLRELLKFTPQGHPDRGPLSTTHDTMIQVANHLNEMRRQKLAFTRVLDIKTRLSELSFQLVSAMKNSPVENPIMKHNFNSIEQVKNSIIKPHRHFVNEVLVKVIRDKVSPLKIQWVDKAINMDMQQTEPIQFESYLFNDYYLLVIKGEENEKSSSGQDDSAFITLPSASIQQMQAGMTTDRAGMTTDRSNYSIFLKTPRDSVLDFANMEEILGQKELMAPFIVQPFYMSMSDFSCVRDDPCAMRCKDYISGAEFRVMFDSEDTRNEWYSSINDKKSTEIQKLVKQMTEKYTKAKVVTHEFIGSETSRAREMEDAERKAKYTSIEKFNKIGEFIQEKIAIQNKFIKMRSDFETIKKTFDKEYDKYQTLKMILSRMKEQPDIYEKKQKQVLDYETEMVKTKGRLKDACDRLQKGESVFNQMIERTKECDEVILMCLRNDIESLIAFFGDSQILDQPEIVDLREVLRKMHSIEHDTLYTEIEQRFPKSKTQPLSVSQHNIINSSFHKLIPNTEFDEDSSSETGSTISNAQTMDELDEELVPTKAPNSGKITVPKLAIAPSSPKKEDKLSKQVEELETKNKTLLEENENLQNTIQQLKDLLETERNNLNQVVQEKDQIQELNAELAKKNSELNDELETLKQQTAKQSESSISKRRSKSDVGVPSRNVIVVDQNSNTLAVDNVESKSPPTNEHDPSDLVLVIDENKQASTDFVVAVAVPSSEDLGKKITDLTDENIRLADEVKMWKAMFEKESEEKSSILAEKHAVEEQLQQLRNSIESSRNDSNTSSILDEGIFNSDFDSEDEQHSPRSSSSNGKPSVPSLSLSNTSTTFSHPLSSKSSRSRIQEHVEMYESLSRSKDSSRFHKKKSKGTNDLMLISESESQSIDNKILKITIQTIQYQLQTERVINEQHRKAQSLLHEEVKVYKKRLEEAYRNMEEMKSIVFTHFGVDIPKTPNH